MMTMLFEMTHHWWMWVLRGVLAVTFGILAFTAPAITITVMLLFFGVYVFFDGILAVAVALRAKPYHLLWWSLLLEGIAGIGAGFVTFLWPEITAVALVWLVAAWAVVSGIFAVAASARQSRTHSDQWMLGIGGIASVVLGLLLFVAPQAGILFWTWMIGFYALVAGVLSIAFGLRLHHALPRSHDGLRAI